jgi:hypothetical protein
MMSYSNSPYWNQLHDYDIQICDKIATAEDTFTDPPEELQNEDYDIYNPMEPEAEIPEADAFTPEMCENLISAMVLIPKGDVLLPATVIGCKWDKSGNPIGVANANPILDTRIYDVQFSDGHMETFAANVIAENIFSQLDNEGRRHLILDEIIDHRCDHRAISIDDKYTMHNGRQSLRCTTQGWHLLVRWRNGTTSWEPLRNLKESNPIKLAEYAMANKLSEETAFHWWVPFTLKKRDRIISASKTWSHKHNQKLGIKIPQSVERALAIDQETNTSLWKDAIEKEMKHVLVAFDVLEDGAEEPRMSKCIPCHMVFDVKMDFTHKALCSRRTCNGPTK